MAENLLKKWEVCLNNGDLDGIVRLYTDDAVLWGTFSDVIRDRHELIREYFEVLFLRKNLKVKFGESNLRSFGQAAIYSGEYEFSYEDNKTMKCPARFSFVFYKDKNNNYRIIDHHSSLIPDSC
ncbi:MAG: nuclear transport factor 2 family protein [Gammaproteobacteria bacterium]